MGMNPRLLRPILSGDTDALRYIAAVQAADQQSLEPAVRKAITDFVVGCKADGIWSAVKASCILMGARTLSGALTPLAGTAPTNVNFVSGDYNRKTGLVGDGSTKYLDTNRAGNADPRNDCHACVYGSTIETSTGATVRILLASGDPSVVKNIGLFHYSGAYYFNNRRAYVGNTTWATALQTSGFIGTSRSSESTVIGRAKQTDNTFSVSSVAPSAEAVVVFAGRAGSSISDYSAARLAFYSIGGALTLSLLDSRVTTLYDAIGAAIP